MNILLKIRVWQRNWKYRNESPEDREERIASNREKLAQKYDELIEKFNSLPDSRDLREIRRIVAQAVDPELKKKDESFIV